MSSGWPKVKLGELLTLRRDVETVRPDGDYQFVGVYSFGRGLFTSVRRAGSEFKYDTVIRLRENDLVYPKLMAWEGAIGVVRKEHAGGVVSPEFPVFTVDTTRVQPEYLDLVVRGPIFQKLLSSTKSAGTNLRRRRLYPDALLQMEIPLPSQSDQFVIIKRADAISQIRLELDNHYEDAVNLQRSIIEGAQIGCVPRVALRDLLTQVRRAVDIDRTSKYRGAGVLSYAKGLFSKGEFVGATTSYSRMFIVEQGDFVYSRLFAWEGAFALATAPFDGAVMSQEFPMFQIDESRLLPAWLMLCVGRREFWTALMGAGLGQRRKRVQPEELLDAQIPLPDLEEQTLAARRASATDGLRESIDKQRLALDELSRALITHVYGS